LICTSNADEEEGGVAPVGAPEVAVGLHEAQVAEDFPEDIAVESARGVGGGHFEDAEADDDADACQGCENGA
jgi:hypothetical protein